MDTTVDLSGVAAALGIVGAATGYVINLIRNCRNERRRSQYRGTHLVILALLEDSFWIGLSAETLWELYRSPATAEMIREYGALSPKRLTNRVLFEKKLRQLQLESMIDLAGEGHYRVHLRSITMYEWQEALEAPARSIVRTKDSRGKLREIARRVLNSDEEQPYLRRDALRVLMSLRDKSAIDDAVVALDSPDNEVALAAAEALAPYMLVQEAASSEE